MPFICMCFCYELGKCILRFVFLFYFSECILCFYFILPFQKGILLSNNSLTGLYHYLHNKYDLKYILTYIIDQTKMFLNFFFFFSCIYLPLLKTVSKRAYSSRGKKR
ncbi:unnamed protein product [Psylliodes chrysocephalus]|uniref:Uncharacterized protein n=1 Tax=Psylliodes chrysocephalus TaxID=3402493 RepID=A0A9P0D3S4_9CUCU|nr:unnamed protein product [Psylliodes chrysocephala]